MRCPPLSGGIGDLTCGAGRPGAGMAEPAEAGRVALVEVTRPQRHTCRG